jgi:hypothetical protein
MRREGSRKETPQEGLREERAALVHRYTVAGPGCNEIPREVDARGAERERARPSPRGRSATDYLIEVELVRRLLWRWSLFELIELRGDGTQPRIPGRSLEPVAKAGVPRLSRRAAVRAAESAAQALSSPATDGTRRPSPAAKRPPKPSRLIVLLSLLLLAAALVVGTIVETRGNSKHASRTPLSPPATTRSGSRPYRRPLSARRAAQLNAEGYSRMRRGNYASALPLLERAVGRLRGTGSLNEAYAEFNLANTRYHLGKCDGVAALLGRSQRIQGERSAIDNLRGDAQRTCR